MSEEEELSPPEEELSTSKAVEIVVENRAHGWRLDHYLSRLYPNYSRESFKKGIQQEAVLVNGLPSKVSRRLRVNDCLSVKLPKLADKSLPAENIPIDVIYEDDSIVVINKTPNMIVHPGKGNYGGTLAGALQFHFDQLSDTAGELRPGIVHRLDRNTSGVMVVAKDNQVHNHLSSQFEKREVRKQYRAIVWGEVQFDSDYINVFMRVHRRKREKMIVCADEDGARDTNTFYEVLERFPGFSYMKLSPKTGRTHQLRVHMQYLGHPVVADSVYDGREKLMLSDIHKKNENSPEILPDDDRILIKRQALHAYQLEFCHPKSGQMMKFQAPLPKDFTETLEALRK